jgi:hypothetical protein
MKTFGNDSAFTGVKLVEQNYPLKPKEEYTQGLTKRELFAAMAMQGLVSGASSSIEIMQVLGSQDETILCKSAVQYADALIDQLNQKESKDE